MNDEPSIEYIFFHREPYRRFMAFLARIGVSALKESVDHTDVEGFVVHLADNLDDALSERIEAYYDEMQGMDEELVVDEQDGGMSQVGVAVTLKDGRSVLASVQPDVLNRILAAISHQELGEFVDAIVDAAENPDERPLCKRN